MAVKKLQQPSINPSARLGGYILVAYWGVWAVIYVIKDIFLDLYTDEDFLSVVWYAGVIVLPITAYTLYLGRQSFFSAWYTYLFYPLLIYGLYLGSAYFTYLNLDLLASAAFKNTTEQVTSVEHVERIFARKLGFTHTDVVLHYQGKSISFQGTRSSYFLLKPHKRLQIKIGRSYLGNYYVSQLHLPAAERWAARWAYWKDWFHRYWWLLILLPILFMLRLLTDKFFPPKPADKKVAAHPYLKFLKTLGIILLAIFGLFMLMLLYIGLFVK